MKPLAQRLRDFCDDTKPPMLGISPQDVAAILDLLAAAKRAKYIVDSLGNECGLWEIGPAKIGIAQSDLDRAIAALENPKE
jgi:hypothetical protein